MSDSKLNPQQLEAVKHPRGPLLIIAGAGTGKTTVITERIKHLILKKDIKPENILALTYTEKAASEMEQRVDLALPYGYTQMWISTFHSFCDRILRLEAIHIGLNPGYKLATETESVLFLRKNFFKFDLNYFRPLGNPDKFLSALLIHFSRLKDEDITPDEYISYAHKFRENKNIEKEEIEKTLELAYAFKTYEGLKEKQGVMDFSDLISQTLKLFRIRKNILKSYQNQFKFVLVDEFQDTNYSQNKLASMLAGEDQNITVVGDDDQAIYRWRGAAISNIIQFRKEFPKAKVITLTKNYRSNQEILDKSYQVISNNNPDRLEIKENVDKKLVSEKKQKDGEIKFLFGEKAEDEASLVTEKIKQLSEKNKIEYKDIAILVRANDHSLPFARALERANIPYQFLGPGQLFRQEEIKDLISYLRVLYNFEDSPSLYRVLTIPYFQIDTRDIAALLNHIQRTNLSLFEAIEVIENINVSQDSKKKMQNILKIIKSHLKLVRSDSAGQILYYFLKDSGLISHFVGSETFEENRAANIAKFFDKLKSFETESQDSSVLAVVEWIDLAMEMGESPLASNTDWSENNAVNILTIHSSKGLEFEAVFLVNLVNGRFPSKDRKESIPVPQPLIKEILPIGDYHIQEERRLFYVGMTRAKDHLFMTAAKFYGEGKRENKISPFVYETFGAELEKITAQTSEKKLQLSLLDWEEKEIPKVHPPANIPQITYISYSQIQTFEYCPLHYKLKYILRIPTPLSAAQSFGTSVHSTLRDFYQKAQVENLNVDYAKNILEKNWISQGYKSREHEKATKQKAQEIILDYLSKYYDPKNLPIALEYPFNFMVQGIKVGGRIDRIDKLEDGRIEIIDYKTGVKLPTQKDLLKNLQLTTYALAATLVNDKILNRKPEELVLSLYFLEKEQKLSTIRNKEELEQSREELLAKVREIESSDFLCSKINCKNCEYKMICSSR